MKRRKAIAFNAGGPTINYLSNEAINRVMNGAYPAPVSTYNGSGKVFGGTDYTYKPNRGSFRKQFDLWNEMLRIDDLSDNCYKIGSLLDNLGKKIEVYSFFGYRITVDVFDENAVIDFSKPIENDSVLEYAIGKFLVHFGKRFKIQIVNEHLLNMFQREC